MFIQVCLSTFFHCNIYIHSGTSHAFLSALSLPFHLFPHSLPPSSPLLGSALNHLHRLSQPLGLSKHKLLYISATEEEEEEEEEESGGEGQELSLPLRHLWLLRWETGLWRTYSTWGWKKTMKQPSSAAAKWQWPKRCVVYVRWLAIATAFHLIFNNICQQFCWDYGCKLAGELSMAHSRWYFQNVSVDGSTLHHLNKQINNQHHMWFQIFWINSVLY